LSEENLEVLTEAGLDYIVSRPLRRNRISKGVIATVSPEIKDKLKVWKDQKIPLEEQECFLDATIGGRRFVVSHNEEIARQTKRSRRSLLNQATLYIKWRVARTLGQHQGTIPVQGKALTHEETLLNLHDYLRDRKLGRYYRIGLDDAGRVRWAPDQEARDWENEIDGKLLLETTNLSLNPHQVVHQYKELQEIERCFRTLKSSLDIRPVYHWVDRRIRAHIFICVMALTIERLMRHRLQKAKIKRSPERVLEKLSFQRTVVARVNGKTIEGLIPPTAEQLTFFKALNIPEPQYKHLSDRAL